MLKSIRKEATKEEVAKVDDEMFEIFKPKQYDGPNGAEVKFIKSFEDSCNVIAMTIQRDPKKMSVIEYYQAINYIKQIHKNAKPNLHKRHNKG